MTNAVGWDYGSSHAEFFKANPTERDTVNVWNINSAEVLDNGESGSSKFFHGLAFSASRPFSDPGSKFEFENGWTYSVGGSTWVVGNEGTGFEGGELQSGYTIYTVDLPVPDLEPVILDQEYEKPDGALALTSSALAAAALFALNF